jgi:tetratricopeptide (TPR) repeat protein
LLSCIAPATAQNAEFDSLADQIEITAISKKEKSGLLLEELYRMACASPDSALLICRCLYTEAVRNKQQSIVDTTLTTRIKSRLEKIPQGSPPSAEKVLLLSALGVNMSVSGNYAESFTSLLQALELQEVLNNPLFTAKILNSLGGICNNLFLYDIQQKYFNQALELISPSQEVYYLIKVNSLLSNIHKGSILAVIDSMQSIIKECLDKRHDEISSPLLLNLAACYIDSDELDKAYHCYSQLMALDLDNPTMTAILYNNMGYYYVKKKQYEEGLEQYRIALQFSGQNMNLNTLEILYNNFSNIFEYMGRPDSALFYARKSQELIQNIRSGQSAVDAYQKYVTTYLENSKNLLTLSKQEVELRNKQMIIVGIASAFIVVVILLLFRQRKRKKEMEHRELVAQMEHQQKVEKIEKEKQEEMIHAQNREISSYALLLTDKNHILQQILDLNTKIHNKQGNTSEHSKKIEDIIRSNFNVDEEWNDFKLHFDKVHPRFFEKLKTLCPDLTEDNLRICSYFKIGMTTKQIAQLLHIMPRSVFMIRFRLRKKLELSEEEDLDSFIRKL